MNGDNVTYFDSFGAGHIPKEFKKSIANKNIITNIYVQNKGIQFNNV